MIDLFEAMQNRRSIRRFKQQAPDTALIKELIHHATLAPNAMNRQDWHYTIILTKGIQRRVLRTVEKKWEYLCSTDSGTSEALRSYTPHFKTFIHAPVLIVVHVRRPPAFMEHILSAYAKSVVGSMASACMAVQNLLLAAHARGLGTCVYTGCNVAEPEILKVLGIQANRNLVCMVAVGYPDEDPPNPGRKPLEEVTTILT